MSNYTVKKYICNQLSIFWSQHICISGRVRDRRLDDFPQYKPLTCGDRIILVQQSQYHGCWCPGSLRRHDIGAHDIAYVLHQVDFIYLCHNSVWRNDINCKYMFMLLLKNKYHVKGWQILYISAESRVKTITKQHLAKLCICCGIYIIQ